jgi:hypothetical protein
MKRRAFITLLGGAARSEGLVSYIGLNSRNFFLKSVERGVRCSLLGRCPG